MTMLYFLTNIFSVTYAQMIASSSLTFYNRNFNNIARVTYVQYIRTPLNNYHGKLYTTWMLSPSNQTFQEHTQLNCLWKWRQVTKFLLLCIACMVKSLAWKVYSCAFIHRRVYPINIWVACTLQCVIPLWRVWGHHAPMKVLKIKPLRCR